MATPAPFLSEIAKEGPVLNLLNNHLCELREKLNRISQIEELRAQGKTLNKEQEETLRSKPYAVACIDELEKIRQPLLSAIDQEIKLVLAKCGSSREIATEIDSAAEPEGKEQSGDDSAVSDLLNLLYFVTLFDLETLMRANDNVVRRKKERNFWLAYDSVMEDYNDNGGVRLKEFDLNLIARIGEMLISRPVNSSLWHKESLEECAEHAKLWLANADQPIEAASTFTYARLRKKINRIMASPYFTTTPAAAAGNGMNPNPNPINFNVHQDYLLWCQQNGMNISNIPPKLSCSSSPKRKKLSSSERYSESEDDDAPSGLKRSKVNAGGSYTSSGRGDAVSDLLNLLYFVGIFDLKTLIMADENVVRRTKERNCWLAYDSVRKDDNGGDRLKEFDLNLIARVGGLLISRPVNSSLSHKESLEKCTEHAKLWLANADQPIEAASTITYAGLRKRINRIMASPYFTTTPETKTSVCVAAAAGNEDQSLIEATLQRPMVVKAAKAKAKKGKGKGKGKGEFSGTNAQSAPGQADNALGHAAFAQSMVGLYNMHMKSNSRSVKKSIWNTIQGLKKKMGLAEDDEPDPESD